MNRSTYTLSELATAIGAVFQGDGKCQIHDIASIVHAKPGDISLVSDPHYQKYLTDTKASAVLIDETLAKTCPRNALIMPNPKLGFVKLIELLRPQPSSPPGVHPTAAIGPGVTLGEHVRIGPHAVIEGGAKIGSRSMIGAGAAVGEGTSIGTDCCLYSRATVYHHCMIGDRTLIHSGAVIGADGFGLAQ